MPRPLATALVVVCCASSGTARATDTATCRNGSFPTQETAFGLASVVGTPRTYLRSDTPPCPDDSAECRGRVYVVPGGIVLTGATNGAYVCAFFPSRNSGSAGYARRDELAPPTLARFRAAGRVERQMAGWRQQHCPAHRRRQARRIGPPPTHRPRSAPAAQTWGIWAAPPHRPATSSCSPARIRPTAGSLSRCCYRSCWPPTT